MVSYDEAKQAADNLMREAWNLAVEQARSSGYENGTGDGYNSGYEVGYDKGFADGVESVGTVVPAHQMAFGPSLGIWGEGRGAPYFWENFNEWGPWGIWRDYQNGQLSSAGPASIPAVRLAMEAGIPNLCLSIKPGGESDDQYNSIARGDWDRQIQDYLNKWPAGMGGYFLMGNEPDQNKKALTPAKFKAAVEHLAEVLIMPPGVQLGIALMEWSWNPSNPRTKGDGSIWLPDVDKLVLCVHYYSESTTNYRAMADNMPKVLADKPEAWPWIVGETNCPEHPTDRMAKANWHVNNAAWAYAHRCEALMPWAGPNGASWNQHIRTSEQVGVALKHIADTYWLET